MEIELHMATATDRNEYLILPVGFIAGDDRTAQTPSENFMNIPSGHLAMFPPDFTVRLLAQS